MLGLALLFVGAGGVIVDSTSHTPAQAVVLGGNVPVNAGAIDLRDINSHSSPTVVRNPRSEANLAIANRIDTPSFSCALHVSFDSAASWTQTPLPVPIGEEPKCYAPEVAFGPDGVLYVSYVTLQGPGNVPHAVWLVSSRDGGRTLSDPQRALGPLAFQVRLVSDTAAPGRLYLFWLQAEATITFGFPEGGYPIRFSRSDDGGATWQAPATVNSRGRQRVVAPSPAVGVDGALHTLYLDLGGDRLDYEGAHEGRGGEPYAGRWKLVLATSRDDGRTWRETVVEDRLVPSERFLVFLPPYPSLAVDRPSGRMYAAYHDGRLGDRDVWLWRSDDGGKSFGRPKRVNDTPPGDGTSQYLARLAVSSTGRLDVVYYDRRRDRKDVMNEVSFQSSFDAGKSFGPRLRVSDRPFDSRIGFGSERELPDLGSRLALLSIERRALAVWTDTRAGTLASNKQDLVQAVVEVTGPRRLPIVVRVVAVALVVGGVVLFLTSLVIKVRDRLVTHDERQSVV